MDIENTKDVVNRFNNILLDLTNQVCNEIGTSYVLSLEKIIKSNYLLPIEQFYIYSSPYKEYINNKDIKYFNNINIDNIVEDKDENIIKHILDLKTIFDDLDEESKNNIWDFLIILLFLSEKYVDIYKKK